jgi:hypothetical protein
MMRNIYGILISLIALNACNNQSKVNKISNENIVNSQRILSQSEKEYYDKYDILDSDSIKIEGQVGLFDLRQNMEKVFGKPIKVEESEYCVSFFNDDMPTKTFIHYGNTVFEVYEDKAALCLLDFPSTDKTLIYNQIRFNKNTRIEDLQVIFPKSYSQKYQIEGTNELNKRIVIPILICRDCDAMLLLIFENNKLVQIENHMDC